MRRMSSMSEGLLMKSHQLCSIHDVSRKRIVLVSTRLSSIYGMKEKKMKSSDQRGAARYPFKLNWGNRNLMLFVMKREREKREKKNVHCTIECINLCFEELHEGQRGDEGSKREEEDRHKVFIHIWEGVLKNIGQESKIASYEMMIQGIGHDEETEKTNDDWIRVSINKLKRRRKTEEPRASICWMLETQAMLLWWERKTERDR